MTDGAKLLMFYHILIPLVFFYPFILFLFLSSPSFLLRLFSMLLRMGRLDSQKLLERVILKQSLIGVDADGQRGGFPFGFARVSRYITNFI